MYAVGDSEHSAGWIKQRRVTFEVMAPADSQRTDEISDMMVIEFQEASLLNTFFANITTIPFSMISLQHFYSYDYHTCPSSCSDYDGIDCRN